MNEKEYLDRETQRELAAIRGESGQLSRELGERLDVEEWIRRRPFVSLGAGTLAGAVAGRWLRGAPRRVPSVGSALRYAATGIWHALQWALVPLAASHAAGDDSENGSAG